MPKGAIAASPRLNNIHTGKKRKVTIDARWLAGGIGTYIRHLLEGLWNVHNGIEVHAITQQRHAPTLKKWCSRVTVLNVPIYTMREQWLVPLAAKGCDLLHVPHYNAPLFGRRPTIASIHDLTHITDAGYSGSLKSRLYAKPMLNLVARRAAHIVTISEYSKAQIVERLRVSEDRVTAIHCAVSPEFRPRDRRHALQTVSARLEIRQPYILYVGNLKPHKNVSTLLRAFALLRKRRQIPHNLVIVGDDRRGKPPLLEECARLGIAETTQFVPSATQELLPNIYAAADLLVMPSRLEGFGLTVLEAMACGTPVVCSRASSLPEVGGEAVLYFDPHSIEEMAAVIERALSSSELRENLSVMGIERAKRFSPAEFTRKHVELYERLLA